MIAFVIGMFVGVQIAVIVVSLLVAARDGY
jgi:hypothetical protein